MTETTGDTEKRGWFARLKAGLNKTSTRITGSITGVFTKRKLDKALLDELEEALIAADLGPATAAKLTGALSKERFGKDITTEETREVFAAEVARILAPVAKPLEIGDHRPHDVLLVLDATVGQNAHSQVEIFKEICSVTGLVVTKLDGSAKGGVLVALADRFTLPVVAIGVGESADDLKPFAAENFARALMGID